MKIINKKMHVLQVIIVLMSWFIGMHSDLKLDIDSRWWYWVVGILGGFLSFIPVVIDN